MIGRVDKQISGVAGILNPAYVLHASAYKSWDFRE